VSGNDGGLRQVSLLLKAVAQTVGLTILVGVMFWRSRGEAVDGHIAAGNFASPWRVQLGWGRESIDAQSLIDAGLDPDDPQVWADQYQVSDLLVCLEIWQSAHPAGGD
jgi:hypothetical protein